MNPVRLLRRAVAQDALAGLALGGHLRCWCWYATWYEDVAVSGFRYRASDGRVGDLGLGVHSVVSKWLPSAAASGSLVIGLAKMITGRGSVRFLLTAGGLVGIKTLTLGIEALIRS
jgi:hypothetical protein